MTKDEQVRKLIRHWTLLDITHCGHCPFYVADKCRCKREVPSKRIDRPYESVPVIP